MQCGHGNETEIPQQIHLENPRTRPQSAPRAFVCRPGSDLTIDLFTFESLGVWQAGFKTEVTALVKANHAALTEDWNSWHS
jgi:hypothetical protein